MFKRPPDATRVRTWLLGNSHRNITALISEAGWFGVGLGIGFGFELGSLLTLYTA